MVPIYDESKKKKLKNCDMAQINIKWTEQNT